jgi:hypothetical protein
MDILSSLFNQPRRGGAAIAPKQYAYSAVATSSKRRKTEVPTMPSKTAVMTPPNAPKVQSRKTAALKSPQRTAASNNLRLALEKVLEAFFARGLESSIQSMLRKHLSYYEYEFVLTKSTSRWRKYYPNDTELIGILVDGWTCHGRYLEAVVREQDEYYWKRQEKEGFVPVQDAEYAIRLDRAIKRCEDVRKELCDRQVSLTLL